MNKFTDVINNISLFLKNIDDNPTQNEALHSNILFIVLLPCFLFFFF